MRTGKTPLRLGALDFYRFVAAFGVVLLHFSGAAAYSPHAGFGGAISQFYLFVDFFFILSGYVIALTYFDKVATLPQIFEFLRRRIARIYPIYALTFLICLASAAFNEHIGQQNRGLKDLLQDALMVSTWSPSPHLPLNFPAWSVSVEWALYLFFPVTALLCRRFGLAALVILIVGGFLLNEILIARTPPYFWFCSISPVRGLPTFSIGILISRIAQDRDIRFMSHAGLALFITSIFLILFHTNAYLVIAIFSAAILATAVGKQDPVLNGRIARHLGDTSYSLYMLHSLTVILFVKILWPRLAALHQAPIWFGFAIAIITTCIATISFAYFERPARDVISGKHAIPGVESAVPQNAYLGK